MKIYHGARIKWLGGRKGSDLVNEEIREKTCSAYVEIGFNKRVLDHGDVLRRVWWKLIRGSFIAEDSDVGVVVEIRLSNSNAGQCTNP